MSPALLRALRLVQADVVLLVARRGTYGSSDCRKVYRPTVRRLLEAGYIKLDISHGDDMANGYRLTESGVRLLSQFPEGV